MLSGKSSAEDSEDGSLKSVDMELDIETKRPSRPSSCSESIASSSPSDLSSPVSLSSRAYPTNHRSKLLARNSLQSSTQAPFSSISVSVPRTVPCIVLSPNEMYNPPLYTSNSSLLSLSPDSIMTKMSKLSNSGQGTFLVLSNRRSDNDGCCANEETKRRTNTIQLHDSLKQIIEANNITGDSTKLFLDCDTSEQRNQSPVNTASKQLTFGMDRILGNDKTARETKDADETKPTYSDTTGFVSSKVHQHQHQHPNYISHCSECFLLSRFCYKLQIPTQRQPVSASACSSNYSSWIPTQHLYDNPALLSPSELMMMNGLTRTKAPFHSKLGLRYNHQHPVLSSYGITASNYSSMSSMVSCNTGGSGRRKRSWSRAVFSNLQRKGLEKRFQIQKYITKPDRRQLAATLGLTDPQVKVWFQNRRMKWRHTTEGKARIDETTPNSNSSSNHKSGTVVRNK